MNTRRQFLTNLLQSCGKLCLGSVAVYSVGYFSSRQYGQMSAGAKSWNCPARPTTSGCPGACGTRPGTTCSTGGATVKCTIPGRRGSRVCVTCTCE